jgi:hypothetical protein
MQAFLADYRAGKIIGERAVAFMAQQATEADAAERAVAGRQRAAAASAALRAAGELSDDELYSALFPTPEEAQQRRDVIMAAAEARAREPLTDDEVDALFGDGGDDE